MPSERMKQLKQRMQAERDAHRAAVKNIVYLLPDLKGPHGNAFWLLGEAKRLMKEAGIPADTQTMFSKEAKEGDYTQLLRTIHEWFTLSEPIITHRPVTDFDAILAVVEKNKDVVDPDAEEQVEAEAAGEDTLTVIAEAVTDDPARRAAMKARRIQVKYSEGAVKIVTQLAEPCWKCNGTRYNDGGFDDEGTHITICDDCGERREDL
jgi:hypothetical protein